MDSKLQIISGAFRGRKLHLPAGARPTQNRARGALFNMLDGVVDGDVVVWDAFAGSGAFGIEILSRYPAARAIFTDTAPASINTVRKNLDLVRAADRATVAQADAVGAISKYGAAANLVFVDPPYAAADVGAAFVRKLAAAAQVGTILVWETDGDADLPVSAAWEIIRDRKYGRARFRILRLI